MDKIPFRTDEYGKMFYIENNGKFELIPFKVGKTQFGALTFNVKEDELQNVTKITMKISSTEKTYLQRLGFRLGVDTYMVSFPDWNDKLFPTALRCEKKGFWSSFMSPLGDIVSVCSPSKIVSWKNEYKPAPNDVSHRIYTSSVEFINTYKQPERHPESPSFVDSSELTYELYYSLLSSENELPDFVYKYSGINIPTVNKFTLQKNEPLIIDGAKYQGELKNGLNIISNENSAEICAFVRDDWFHYLNCARKNAEKCQQKPGTHAESWYGFFSLVAYAKAINDKSYTGALCERFDSFFKVLTKGYKVKKMRLKALPHRLQNTSCMLSLLADFYELTGNMKYLNHANDLAGWLMSLQAKDGSYRSHGTHYTCVIYPAKSMLELALVEKNAGLTERYEMHYSSAYRAIQNLYELMDNIETEGEMTFEDGMISCESLQLGFLATVVSDKKDKERFAAAAKTILSKHKCLEQQFLPDCRTRGCTLRYWEARYDVNFASNMLNCPHGWTSWKTYATYYLYILTGELSYLVDTMNTIGACMQCVDKNGELNWAFIADPSIVGKKMVKANNKYGIDFEDTVVGEEYIPMVSDWYRHSDKKLQKQYIYFMNNKRSWKNCYGGSCDNDVHEHFKCLDETVFGKAFVHECENGEFVLYNCEKSENGFVSNDKYVKQFIVFSLTDKSMTLNDKEFSLSQGINEITL